MSGWTNPKSLLFMFTFLPLFVDPAAGPGLAATAGAGLNPEAGRDTVARRRGAGVGLRRPFPAPLAGAAGLAGAVHRAGAGRAWAACMSSGPARALR